MVEIHLPYGAGDKIYKVYRDLLVAYGGGLGKHFEHRGNTSIKLHDVSCYKLEIFLDWLRQEYTYKMPQAASTRDWNQSFPQRDSCYDPAGDFLLPS